VRTINLSNESLVQPAERSHLVLIYRHTAALADAVSLYLSDGLGRGEAAVVISTRAHWNDFRRGLEKWSLDPTRLQNEGRLVVKDARETLDSFMRDGMPDPTLFRNAVCSLFSRLALGGWPRVRAFGEMVSLLWRNGNPDGAVRLEELWSEVVRDYEVTLLCAYHGHSLAPEFHGRSAQGIYREHSHLLPPEESDRLTDAVDLAMEEVLGESQTAALRPMIAATRRRLNVRPGAQASLLWLQAHLPGRLDDVLASARRHSSRLAEASKSEGHV